MQKKWMYATLVVAIIAVVGGVLWGISFSKKKMVLQNWQNAQYANRQVLQTLSSLQKNESGLSQATDVINLHILTLRDFKEKNDRLIGGSYRYTTLCDSFKCQSAFFEELLAYCQTRDGIKLNSATGRADDWKRRAELMFTTLPQAEKMPDSQMLDKAILRVQQVVGSVQSFGASSSVPALLMPVPPPPNSTFMQQARLLLAEYKGTRQTFNSVLARYNPSYDSWYSFKNRSDYRAEVDRRISIRRRLENLSPSSTEEQSIQSAFISFLNYAVDVMNSGSREDITTASQLLSKQLASLEKRIGG